MRLPLWFPLSLGILVGFTHGFGLNTRISAAETRFTRYGGDRLSALSPLSEARHDKAWTWVDSRRHKCVRDSSGFGRRACGLLMSKSNDEDSDMVFAGVKFASPISSSLRNLGIRDPSPIQDEAVLALSTGLSCIIHAETGSGKTLCYLLPLMKKLLSSGVRASADLGVQALIVVPSKELAIQVAADVATLISKRSEGNNDIDTSMVHLCIESGRAGLDNVNAPVVIGTPYKLMDAVRSSSKSSLDNLDFLVLDEVDRMLQVSSKYASNEARKKANSVKNPVKDLVADIIRIRGFVPPDKNGLLPPEATSSLQVVAASATIGRPLRRELYHLLLGGGERTSQSAGELPLIRAETPMRKPISDDNKENDATVTVAGDDVSIEDLIAEGEEETEGVEDGEAVEKMRGKTSSRKIGIPSSIRHVALMLSDQSESLTSKISTVKQIWTSKPMNNAHKAMLFVPSPADVKQATGMLSFMGLSSEVRDLQGELGIVDPANDKSKGVNGSAKKYTPQKEIYQPTHNKSSTKDLVERAAKSKLGAWSVSEVDGEQDSSMNEGPGDSQQKEDHRELYVIPLSGTRGLHIKDIEYVIITAPPKTMDEYLHVAGRTGRAGNTVSGTVVTLASYEDLKRLQSWETPLGINFDVQYE